MIPGIVASAMQAAGGGGGGPVATIDLVATRGAIGDTAASLTTAVDMVAAGSITVGNYLIARAAVDNSGAAGAAPGLTVTDTVGNTWTVLGPALQDPGADNTGTAAYIAYAKVVNAFTNGDDVTFTFGTAVTADCLVIEEWQNIHATSPIAVSPVTASNTSSTAQPSLTLTPNAVGDLVYGCLAVEARSAGYSGDSDTTEGTWVALDTQACDTGTNTGSQTVAGQGKVVTGTSAQTWNPTVDAALDWAALLVAFAPAPA